MKNQKGTSLVSVIVSFAVMMIVLLLLQVSITASGRYTAEADELWKRAASAENKYVNDIPSSEGGEVEKAGNIDIVMESGAAGADREVWGNIEKWQTTSDDPDGFKIYYFK